MMTSNPDWTFDHKVFRTYTVRGLHVDCPDVGHKIRRRLEGVNEVYEVSSILSSDPARNMWEVEAVLVSVETEVPFQTLQGSPND